MQDTIASRTEAPLSSLSFSAYLASVEAIRNVLSPSVRSRMSIWVQGLDSNHPIDITDPVYFAWLLSQEYTPAPLSNSLALIVAPWNLMSVIERRYLQAWLAILDDSRRTIHGRQEPALYDPEVEEPRMELYYENLNREIRAFNTDQYFD